MRALKPKDQTRSLHIINLLINISIGENWASVCERKVA